MISMLVFGGVKVWNMGTVEFFWRLGLLHAKKGDGVVGFIAPMEFMGWLLMFPKNIEIIPPTLNQILLDQ